MRLKSLFVIILALTFIEAAQSKDLNLTNAPAQVFFSPHGGCTAAIVDALNHSKSEILVQAYSFTSAPIAKALVDAHKRGVHVEVILDKSNRNKKGKYSAADFTAHAGIPTYIDSVHSIAHSKIMILDSKIPDNRKFLTSRRLLRSTTGERADHPLTGFGSRIYRKLASAQGA